MTRQKKTAVIEVDQGDEKLHHKKRAFLAAYRLSGSITKAAELAEIARKTHYEWMKDEDYQRAFEDADEEAGDYLEQEARRRAVEGVTEPVYYKGDVVGEVQKYSDTLLIFLLNGSKPEKYKQRTDVNHAGKIVTEVKHDLKKLSPEELKNLEHILSKTSDTG